MAKIPRILHLTHEMAIGGTQQVISQLVGNLDGERFDCEIGCIDGLIGQLGEELQASGTQFHVFNRGPGFDLELIKSIRNVLKKNDFDVVHCHQYTPYVYGMFASLFTGVKVVYTEHGRFYPDSYTWKRRLVNLVLQKFTDSIVAISAATGKALTDFEWFSAKQIDIIYNGLEPGKASHDLSHLREKFGIKEEHFVFGTIARFDSIKNIPMMINAFKEVHSANSNARLLLVGDGDERQMLEGLAQDAGVADAVVFTGFQQNTADLMSLIDIYLLTSFSEGTSMTLLEAMSSGTCSIVTRVGGNVELIEHEVNGVSVESDDTPALVSCMSALLKDSEKRMSLGAQAAEVFKQRFSVAVMVEAYCATYEKLLRLN